MRLRPCFDSMMLIAPFWRAKSARVQADTGMVVAGGRTAAFPSYFVVRKIALHYFTTVMQPLHAMQQADLRTATDMSVKLGMDHTYRYRFVHLDFQPQSQCIWCSMYASYSGHYCPSTTATATHNDRIWVRCACLRRDVPP